MLIKGLIPPSPGRNRVKQLEPSRLLSLFITHTLQRKSITKIVHIRVKMPDMRRPFIAFFFSERRHYDSFLVFTPPVLNIEKFKSNFS